MFSYERSESGTRYRFFWIPFGNTNVSTVNAAADSRVRVNVDYSDVPIASLSQRWSAPVYSEDGFLYWPGQVGLSMQVF